jgi:hypothetical protein
MGMIYNINISALGYESLCYAVKASSKAEAAKSKGKAVLAWLRLNDLKLSAAKLAFITISSAQ